MQKFVGLLAVLALCTTGCAGVAPTVGQRSTAVETVTRQAAVSGSGIFLPPAEPAITLVTIGGVSHNLIVVTNGELHHYAQHHARVVPVTGIRDVTVTALPGDTVVRVGRLQGYVVPPEQLLLVTMCPDNDRFGSCNRELVNVHVPDPKQFLTLRNRLNTLGARGTVVYFERRPAPSDSSSRPMS